MIQVIALSAASLVACAGVVILWANPRRSVNRSVFFSSAVVAAWLTCTFLAKEYGQLWVRWSCAVGALAPFSLWMVKESILSSLDFSDRAWITRNIYWFFGPLLLAIVPFLEAFIPSHSSDENRITGWAYPVYYAGLGFAYILLLYDSLRKLRGLRGASRLELQLWLCGGLVTVGIVYALIGLSDLTGDLIYRRLQPLAIMFFYAGTGYAITTHRIFEARQLVVLILEKLVLVAIVAAFGYGTYRVSGQWLPQFPSFVVAVAIGLWIARAVDRRLDQMLNLFSEGVSARQAAFTAAQRESRWEELEKSYCALLKGWGHSERAVIHTIGRQATSGDRVDENSPISEALRSIRWATPERLSRERATPERRALAAFLERSQLGVVVIAEGRSLAIMVGVGVPASRRPFTYPQVTQLIELASIMESALERAHFSAKAQHAEQLATVGLLGASLAHEIRNPLVSIKTFVQLLPSHHQDPRFREKFFKLIGDEVGRIDQLTEQLLDLASPRTYAATMVELHPLLRSSLDLVAAKAAHKNVQLLTELEAQPDRAFTDASAAKQVMLNLCFNAIQAVEATATEDRWVKVATRNTARGLEMVVADNGPGIAPEIRPKLFQPFQTTKSTGFGLGLAICSDILANLNASISVDPPAPGCGATFRVTFPCQPLSS
jgi:signal transduction histidine kinase